MKEKLLQADLKTRWNSSYNMIKDCLPYKQAIQFFTVHLTILAMKSENCMKIFVLFLEKFDIATKALSGTSVLKNPFYNPL